MRRGNGRTFPIRPSPFLGATVVRSACGLVDFLAWFAGFSSGFVESVREDYWESFNFAL